jgi:hypothetical protein
LRMMPLSDPDPDVVTIGFEIIAVERVSIGAVLGFITVAVDVAGIPVELVMTVRRVFDGVQVELPTYMRAGRRLPAVVLPDALRDAIGKAAFEAYREAL